MTWWIRLIFVVGLRVSIFGLVPSGWALAASGEASLDASLREAVHSVPVAGTDASIVVTSFRPPGAGP